MDLKPILYILGILISILAVSMTFPMLADLHTQNPDWRVFFLCIVFTAFFGGALILGNAGETFSLTRRQAFILTALSWLLIAAFGALPFNYSELGMDFTDAFFESMSGITTTGATVITDLDHAPPGILLWRAMLQWLGGLGIVVMALSVLPFLKVGGMQLFRTESSHKEKALPRTAQLSFSIVGLYCALTAICLFLYMATGLGTLDSIVHSMTTIATGGFSTRDNSFAAFNNPAAETVAVIFMIVSGLPFVLMLKTLLGDGKALLKDEQVRAYLGIIALSTTSLTAYLCFHESYPLLTALRHSLFNLVSTMTGTGYASADYMAWGGIGISFFMFIMFVGGCAGSTTCGIKIFRFQILYAVARTQVKKLLHPSGMFTPRYDGKPLQDDTITSVMSYFLVFALSFIIASILLSLTGLDLLTSISSAASALANVGPGLGDVVGPLHTFAPLSDTAKWILSFCMLLGRLEFFTLLVMLSPYFWKD